jgi:phosphoribosylformylglycinamidine synthase
MGIIKFYKRDGDKIFCFNIDGEITNEEKKILISLIEPNLELELENVNHEQYIEYGSSLDMVSPWCANCLSVFAKCGIFHVKRVEITILVGKDKFHQEMIDSMTQSTYSKPIEEFKIHKSNHEVYEVHDLKKENEDLKLGFDEFDLQFYEKLFQDLKRNPTNVELYDLAQSNSEHSRHWFFKGILIHDKIILNQSLLSMIKNTQEHIQNKSLVAFYDNSSVFEGYEIDYFYPHYKTHQYVVKKTKYDFTFTSETHNFPTSIAPFQGATTGVGGRIRDNQCVGRGGLIRAGIAGYCVGELDFHKSKYWKKNLKTLIEASDGASDYGNKFGEPLILGFCRTFGMTLDDQRIEWVKPIMFSGGLGQIDHQWINKVMPSEEMLIVKIGGPPYIIGLGGGSSSSRDQNTLNMSHDLNAIQRGDPEMENRLNRLITTCTELEINPILNINDQGAGGTANVTKEIIYPLGGEIDLDKMDSNHEMMSALELWVSEYQENNTILTSSEHLDVLHYLSERENVPMSIIGKVKNTGTIKVYHQNELIMDMPLEPIVGNTMPQKQYILQKVKREPTSNKLTFEMSLNQMLHMVLSSPSVGSKRFLTNKVDRSVTGLVAQQQCVGPLHTPLSNYGIMAQSYFNLTGSVIAIGEQPIKGLLHPGKMARLAIGEMLTNMIFAKITNLEDIKCSANWMWPIKFEGERYNLYKACSAMCSMMKELNIAIDRGKDSLSMSYTDHETKEIIKSPPSLVITGYAPTNNIMKKVTPDFKKAGNLIFYIDLASNHYDLGGSSLLSLLNQMENKCPDVHDISFLKYTFHEIQKLIEQKKIVSGHDRSDGGIIVTLCEMAFAGNLGFDIKINQDLSEVDFTKYLFHEGLGLIIEIKPEDQVNISHIFNNHLYYLGTIIQENKIIVRDKQNNIKIDEPMTHLRNSWELPSFNLEKLQCQLDCVQEEYLEFKNRKMIKYHLPLMRIEFPLEIRKHKVAIIREEGCNSDRELSAAFYMAGFDTYDICMNDFMMDETLTLDQFRGIAFCGGFSYSDVFGAAKGWYQVIKSNNRIHKIFTQFKERDDTFSLGICNGCQLMSLLKWIPKCQLSRNKSNRFESRFVHVRINSSNSILLKGMNESIMGIWVAHGEGRFVMDNDISSGLIPIQYIDDDYGATEKYPHNPNGSMIGIAALCSKDGRHLSMMPHPERCFLNWQWPYGIEDIKVHELYSPWMKMFINAYQWCENL